MSGIDSQVSPRIQSGVVMTVMLPRLRYTVNDVMAVTGRSRTVIYDALTSKVLRGVQAGPGASWSILPADVEQWVELGCPRFPGGVQR